jgi:serine/threonine-protein kinase RsbW
MDRQRHSEAAEDASECAEFVLELPSDLRMIEAAVTYLVDRLRAFAFGGSRLNLNFRVGVTEALANAVLYGNRRDPTKTVRVEVSLDPSRVVLRVVDQGHGFDPSVVPDPTLPDNLQRPGGRGLFLIRQLMDEVEYNDRGNAVRLVLCRDPSRQTH